MRRTRRKARRGARRQRRLPCTASGRRRSVKNNLQLSKVLCTLTINRDFTYEPLSALAFRLRVRDSTRVASPGRSRLGSARGRAAASRSARPLAPPPAPRGCGRESTVGSVVSPSRAPVKAYSITRRTVIHIRILGSMCSIRSDHTDFKRFTFYPARPRRAAPDPRAPDKRKSRGSGRRATPRAAVVDATPRPKQTTAAVTGQLRAQQRPPPTAQPSAGLLYAELRCLVASHAVMLATPAWCRREWHPRPSWEYLPASR